MFDRQISVYQGFDSVKREIRAKACELRSQGLSINEIASQLRVSKSSVSVWVRDIELTEAQKDALRQKQHRWGQQNKGAETNRRRGIEQRIAYQHQGRERAKTNNPLHLAGCMLYWAEGGKSRNQIHFANSDPHMQKLFIRFLREEFDVQDESIKVQIHCHSQDEIVQQKCKDYWLDVLDLPESSLNKIQVKKGSETRKNRLEYGICAIRLYSTQITQHIFGAIQEYGRFDNPAWLD